MVPGDRHARLCHKLVWDVRFERAVAENLLTTWGTSRRKAGRLLIEHRRRGKLWRRDVFQKLARLNPRCA